MKNQQNQPPSLIDVIGKSCPYPLIEMRRAILSANDGDFLIIKGDHEKSFSEIQMGAESMSCEIIEKTIDKNGVWIIKILVKK